MKQFHPAFFLALSLIGCVLAGDLRSAHASLYGNKIVIPPGASAGLQGVAADSETTLEKMTAQEFALAPEYSGSGIFLLHSDAENAPADAVAQLKGKGREPFVIRSRDDKNLWIIANGDAGLQHGLYFYLEQLGARFYFPNENWTIIPARKSIALKIDRLEEPDFKVRNFFGTGGFGPPSPVDPKVTMRERWEQWKRRNRLGGEFSLGGHSGEAFNTAHKAILLQHPEYLAKVDGKHVPWSAGAKLNVANPDAVKLYVNWSVERFRQMRKNNPHAFAVSVDPSDGGGHCNSEECKAIGNGSPSDQVFYLANETARALRKEFPDGWVSLYAYNQHAAVPSFPLEPNVYVAVIPYAFQRTGMSPEELIADWGQKVSRMAIYDYWEITDWGRNLPDFNARSTPRRKLHFWHKSNIEGLSAESTFSAGTMGLGWYVASRLMWDLNTDENVLIEEFYDTSFGPAKAPMKRMTERWSNDFLLIEHELASSYRDLEEAIKLAQGNAPVLARLADYARYLIYLRNMHTVRVVPKEEKAAAAQVLMRDMWRVYDSAMIQTYRLYQLQGRDNADLRALFDPKNKSAAGWQNLTQMSDEEALQTVPKLAKQYQPLPDFTPRRFSEKLVPLPAGTAMPSANEGVNEAPLLFAGTTTIELDAPAGLNMLPLKISSGAAVRVRLLDTGGQVLQNEESRGLEQDRKTPIWEEFFLHLKGAGRYRIVVHQAKYGITRVQPVPGVRFFLRSFRTTKPLPSRPLYFYVPKGQKTIVMSVVALPEKMRPRLWDSTGKSVPVTAHEANSLVVAPVPPGEDGKVWAIDRIIAPNSTMRFLNVPQVFSFYPDGLMVPEDVL